LRSLESTEATTFFISLLFIRLPAGTVIWVFRHEAAARSAAAHGFERALSRQTQRLERDIQSELVRNLKQSTTVRAAL